MTVDEFDRRCEDIANRIAAKHKISKRAARWWLGKQPLSKVARVARKVKLGGGDNDG